MPETYQRAPFDLAEYSALVRTSPCFVCQVVDGTHPNEHPIVYRDDDAIVFLNRFPTLVGYLLVAPIEHREDVVADFTIKEYLRLQSVIHRVGRAVSEVVPTERLYVLSLGSKQGNSHVHWHVAPLPPGVPYERQQYAALMTESGGGYLSIPAADQADLALRIGAAMSQVDAG